MNRHALAREVSATAEELAAVFTPSDLFCLAKRLDLLATTLVGLARSEAKRVLDDEVRGTGTPA